MLFAASASVKAPRPAQRPTRAGTLGGIRGNFEGSAEVDPGHCVAYTNSPFRELLRDE